MEFSQIAVLLSVAAGFGIIAKLLKQPLLVGYLFAGFLLAALGLIPESAGIDALGKIGVALLLFLLGLEMDISEIPIVGKVALMTGFGQIIFTSIIGYILATLLGFPPLTAIYIAIALTFSSTIIIVKLLSEKNDLGSLYGKIAIGFLLVQDMVAILILMFLSGLKSGSFGPSTYAMVAAKGAFLLLSVWFLGKEVLPKVFTKIIDSSTELLFIVAVAWALGVAAFVAGPLGFTIEIGGFLAGLSLSNLPDHLQISSRTRPLRDFFLTLFFVLLGTNLVIATHQITTVIIPAIILSAFVLVGNPIIVLAILGFLGYRKRTSFLASVTVAQISEFSLILMAMGHSIGHVDDHAVALTVLIGVITMTLSTYLILGTDRIYPKIEKWLSIFERKVNKEIDLKSVPPKKDHIILIGSHRTGAALLPILKKQKVDFTIIDFNPKLVEELTGLDLPVIFGDITDSEVLKAANVSEAKMIVSTTADLHDNLTILSHVRSLKKHPAVIMKAGSAGDALLLYKKGADYVIVPEVAAGESIRHIIKTYGTKHERIARLGKSHVKRLQKEK